MPIKTFENETSTLTDYERTVLVPVIIRGFMLHECQEKAITSTEICRRLKTKGFKISDVRLRKCIKHIQRYNLLKWIVGTGTGFYLTKDPDVVKSQIESLKGREAAIRSVREALEQSVNSATNNY